VEKKMKTAVPPQLESSIQYHLPNLASLLSGAPVDTPREDALLRHAYIPE